MIGDFKANQGTNFRGMDQFHIFPGEVTTISHNGLNENRIKLMIPLSDIYDYVDWRREEKANASEKENPYRTVAYPLGVMPRSLWLEQRLHDLLSALGRRFDNGFQFIDSTVEWAEEVVDILEEIQSEVNFKTYVRKMDGRKRGSNL